MLDPIQNPAPGSEVQLTQLGPGDWARLSETDLAQRERETLSALGLTSHCRLRVARAGDPWIVQVRATRIGLSEAIARRIRVLLDS